VFHLAVATDFVQREFPEPPEEGEPAEGEEDGERCGEVVAGFQSRDKVKEANVLSVTRSVRVPFFRRAVRPPGRSELDTYR